MSSPMIQFTGMLDPLEALAQGKSDFHAGNDFATSPNSARELTDQNLDAYPFAAGTQLVAFSAPSHSAEPADARNDLRENIAFPDGNNFPRVYPGHRPKPKNPNNLPADDPNEASLPDDPEHLPIGPAISPDLIAELPPNKKEDNLCGNVNALSAAECGIPTETIGIPILRAQTIPEAATLALLGLGIAGLSFVRRRPA